MPPLEDDIARVAALRGRSADAYLRPNAPRAPVIPGILREDLFRGSNPKFDLAVFDLLPQACRDLLRESSCWMSAAVFATLLEQIGVEHLVIEACADAAERRIMCDARRHYGPKHPQA